MICDLSHIEYRWWYTVFRSKATKIDKKLVKNGIFPQDSWYLVWAKSFIFHTFQNLNQFFNGELPKGIANFLWELKTWSLGRVLFSGSVAGFPRRVLKWESQFSRPFFSATSFQSCFWVETYPRYLIYSFQCSRMLMVDVKIGKLVDFPINKLLYLNMHCRVRVYMLLIWPC